MPANAVITVYTTDDGMYFPLWKQPPQDFNSMTIGNPGQPSQPGFAESLPGLDNRAGHRNEGLGSVSERDSWSPWQREAYALGGIGDGIGQSLSDAFGKDLGSTAMKVGGAAALGGGLAYLKETSSMGRIGAMVIGAGFLYAMGKDVVARAVPTYDALKEAADSGKNLDQNRATIAATAGPFCVDFALTSAGGMLGAGTVRAFKTTPEIVPVRNAGATVPASAESAKPTLSGPATHMLDATTISEEPGAQNAYWKTLSSMLKIESSRPNGVHTGTAVVMTENGRALTDFHVVAHSEKISAITPDGTIYDAVVEKVDPGTDLALLKLGGRRSSPGGKIDYSQEKFIPAELADSNPLPGQEVYAMGYPGDATPQSPKLSLGKVTAIEQPPANIVDLPSTMRPSEDIVRSAVELQPGFSGGPLIARSGDMLAVNFARNQGDLQSFSVPAETIRRFLNSRPEQVDYSKFVPLLKTAVRSPASAAWDGNQAQLGELYQNARKGVVQIMSKGTADGAAPVYATAFAVDPFFLVTDARAVGSVGSPVKATYNGMLQDLLTVERKYPDLGVAILRSDRIAPLNLEPLKLASPRELLAGGQRVVTFGFKADQAEMTASPGQFGSYVPGVGYSNQIKTFASVDNGYGGAPVTNRFGQVIAMTPMVTESAGETNNIHYRNIAQAMRLAGLL
jgi:S1-C subfamily serine protease